MNRKVMVCAMAASFLTGFGCAAQEQNQPKVTVEPARILVVYYSYSGNTKFAAEQIQKATGGTLAEIKPIKAYSPDYKTCVDQAKKEIKDGIKPKITVNVDDIKKYDVIFVGSPNWWSTIAPPVASFLSNYDLAGKIVIPFVTHGGGGMARCESDLRKLCPKSNVLKGGAFSGGGIRQAGESLAKFVNERVTLKK